MYQSHCPAIAVAAEAWFKRYGERVPRGRELHEWWNRRTSPISAGRKGARTAR
jgi:hypothetical protein